MDDEEKKEIRKISMDRLDEISFNAGPSVSKRKQREIILEETSQASGDRSVNSTVSLSGAWDAVFSEEEKDLLEKINDPQHFLPCDVPCSVFKVLLDNNIIEDPSVGRNQEKAREYSYKYWCFRKVFDWTPGRGETKIVFKGVANKCKVYLNGIFLGEHEGMLSSFSFSAEKHLYSDRENILMVILYPIPFIEDKVFHSECNASWKNTVVINNVYGWHYSNLPSLGIWSPVELVKSMELKIKEAFIHTKDIHSKTMGLHLLLYSEKSCYSLLEIQISPKNFAGKSYSYTEKIELNKDETFVDLEFAIPEGRLWQPVDMGEPSLYSLKVEIHSNETSATFKDVFGIRSIEMHPLPGGPYPDKFNWIFCVNEREMFVKGSGWCTMDALLEFPREKYSRFLDLCKKQHIQLLRAWGCGMPETDEFFELCDLNGIMVIQEWPTAWNSHLTQPFRMLEETVVQNTKRIRNHPSLVMYGGGNESSDPYGKAIDMMGITAIELDGTRPFHRGEPFGGSEHNYDSYWGRKHIDHNLKMKSSFWGEFGLASMPCPESIRKYLPENEIKEWPPGKNSSFEYHTPVFGKLDDMDILKQYASYFLPERADIESFAVSTQLAQIEGVRHTLERARTMFPECAGALYYKINDNFPAVSWSSIDWYGAPKISHYAFENAFEPLHSCILFESINVAEQECSLPVYLIDDKDTLKNKGRRVKVRAHDSRLNMINDFNFDTQASAHPNLYLGDIRLTKKMTNFSPLFIISEVILGEQMISRTFYFLNYENRKGCLFELPQTEIELEKNAGIIKVKNTGSVPAAGVYLTVPGSSHLFTADKGFLWIDPGETIEVTVNRTEGVRAKGLNVKEKYG